MKKSAKIKCSVIFLVFFVLCGLLLGCSSTKDQNGENAQSESTVSDNTVNTEDPEPDDADEEILLNSEYGFSVTFNGTNAFYEESTVYETANGAYYIQAINMDVYGSHDHFNFRINKRLLTSGAAYQSQEFDDNGNYLFNFYHYAAMGVTSKNTSSAGTKANFVMRITDCSNQVIKGTIEGNIGTKGNDTVSGSFELTLDKSKIEGKAANAYRNAYYGTAISEDDDDDDGTKTERSETYTCPKCEGTGRCHQCGGSGKNSYNTDLICPICYGNGICNKCKGTGYLYYH